MKKEAPLLTVWIDLEVSSFNPTTGALTQISAIIERDGKEVDSIDLRINPYTYQEAREILDYNLKRSNRTRDEIITYPSQDFQFKLFKEFIDKNLKGNEFLQLAGHNVEKHDSKFIEEWFSENFECMYNYFSYEHLDTLHLARHMRHWGLLNERENLKLKTLCDYFGVPPFDWHDSIQDIRATRELYQEMRKKITGDSNE